MEIWQNDEEVEKLVEEFKQLDPRGTVLEIGSLHGGTLKRWMEHMVPWGKCISIDMLHDNPIIAAEQKHCHRKVWHEWADARNIAFCCFENDSKDPNIVEAVGMIMPIVDFLFIDGDHSEEGVRADWNNYGPMVRDGGMVAFHDIVGGHWPGVEKLWAEIKTKYRHQEFTIAKVNYGIGVLYK